MVPSVHEKGAIPSLEPISLSGGWLCHITVLHGEAAERPDVIRRLEGLLGQKVICKDSK